MEASLQKYLEQGLELLRISSISVEKEITQFFSTLTSVNLHSFATLSVGEFIELAFGPRQIAFQICLALSLQLAGMGYESFRAFLRYVATFIFQKSRLSNELQSKMLQAKSFQEWETFAKQWDKLHHFDAWRNREQTSLLDSTVINKRIADMEIMMAKGDLFNLVFRIRGGLARDQFGLQHEGLFNKALTGTKHIVEKYHMTVCRALDYICDAYDDEMPDDAKLAFFNETRHAYGRTALMLSGGAYLGYYHIGVAKTLWREGLLPRVISGASAGSLIAAAIGTRKDEEFENMYAEGQDGTGPFRYDFFKFETRIKSPIGSAIYNFLPAILKPVLYPFLTFLFDQKLLTVDGKNFVEACQHNCGLYTFQEAFDRTGRIINITVAPINSYDPPRLLNYLTAPHVCVWSAAVASCSIPGVFDPAKLWVKEPNGNFRPEHEWSVQGHIDTNSEDDSHHLYTDGSLENDLPSKQLSELFNVNHFIVSQVNFHSALLSSLSLRPATRLTILYAYYVGYIHFLKTHVKDWLRGIAEFLDSGSNTRTWKKGAIQAVTQSYEGKEHDITIMPWAGRLSLLEATQCIIKNPTHKEYLGVVSDGAVSTFPFLPRIRAHCQVEMTLDKCVQRLRRRITEGADQLTTNASIANPSHGGSQLDRRPAGIKERQDSFYTSRSIVNLSGLSVADPTTVLIGIGPDNIHRATSSNALVHENASTLRSNSRPSSQTDLSGRFQSDDRLNDLAGSTSYTELNDAHTSPARRPGIAKTTNMANFYYKRSESSHALTAIESPFG